MRISRTPIDHIAPGRPLTFAGVADGAEGLVIADLARALAARRDAPAVPPAVVCRDGPRLAALSRALGFFAPDLVVAEFPAWDCLPYDRVSPHSTSVAQRMTALSRLAHAAEGRRHPTILLTTVNAAVQRVPSRQFVRHQSLSVAPGNVLAMESITAWLELNGFARASTVRAQPLSAYLNGPRAGRLRGARRNHRSLRAGHRGAGATRLLRGHVGEHPHLRSRDSTHDGPIAWS